MTRKFAAARKSDNATALFEALKTAVPLQLINVPATKYPTAPASLQELRKGISTMTELFTSDERAGAKKTSRDDVERELMSVMNTLSNRGFAFADLPLMFAFEQNRTQHLDTVTQYTRAANANTETLSAKVATWFADITAVLSVAKVVGADVMADAASAPNKTMAALGIDLHVREKLTASAQAGVPVMAAGRGLMILKTAKIDALSLDLGDVELAAAMALFQYFPDPIEGATMQSAELRFGSIVLRTDADGVVAYREAVQSNASGLLPHTALIAADGKALAALQTKIDTRLSGLDYAFTNAAGNGGMTIEERRLRDFGKSAVTTH
ncbi:hypothetical protein [Pseudomonas sediminis]|uniref:Phage major capsid protein n=1 Tax=Pseudomonas sediminis TaxID=1691904 RepID=A0ABX6SIZ9_9PSED|nr:hypothetical protein [Pseudomonas sediminis]QNG99679.1 hypothetical protein HNQ25_15375 [Pseudomonas sediminis]